MVALSHVDAEDDGETDGHENQLPQPHEGEAHCHAADDERKYGDAEGVDLRVRDL